MRGMHLPARRPQVKVAGRVKKPTTAKPSRAKPRRRLPAVVTTPTRKKSHAARPVVVGFPKPAPRKTAVKVPARKVRVRRTVRPKKPAVITAP